MKLFFADEIVIKKERMSGIINDDGLRLKGGLV